MYFFQQYYPLILSTHLKAASLNNIYGLTSLSGSSATVSDGAVDSPRLIYDNVWAVEM